MQFLHDKHSLKPDKKAPILVPVKKVSPVAAAVYTEYKYVLHAVCCMHNSLWHLQCSAVPAFRMSSPQVCTLQWLTATQPAEFWHAICTGSEDAGLFMAADHQSLGLDLCKVRCAALFMSCV